MTAPATVFNKLCDPLWLYGQTLVTPGANSAPNTAALMNPHGLPMEILEIRWSIYPNTEVANFSGVMTGMGIGVKLDLGDIPIVDADVPINTFGNSRDDDDGEAAQIYPSPPDTDVTAFVTSYRWRLKYPLLIPTGCVLTPLYAHLGQNSYPVTVDTIYICRTLPVNYTAPQNIRVPWVGSFNSVAFDNVVDEPRSRDLSSELDIVNPFAQALELTRIGGRCAAVFNGPALTAPGVVSQTIMREDRTDHRFKLGRLRARARAGDEIARTPTPFNGLFPFGWRTWDIPGGIVLPPGEFYKLQIDVAATDEVAPADIELGTIQYAVTGVGYRQLDNATFHTAAQGAP